MIITSFRVWAAVREASDVAHSPDRKGKAPRERLEMPLIYWSEWFGFDVPPGYCGPAVYQLRLVINGKPIRVPRLLASDKEGILVIGCTGNMDRRFRQAHIARMYGTGGSSLNLLYYFERFTDFGRAFPGYDFEYRIVRLPKEDEAKAVESRLIKQYVCRFGDRPPLNSALPDRYGGWDEATDEIA
jgi:hypothetical protein